MSRATIGFLYGIMPMKQTSGHLAAIASDWLGAVQESVARIYRSCFFACSFQAQGESSIAINPDQSGVPLMQFVEHLFSTCGGKSESMNHKTYLLAADRARAKIYELEPPATCLTVVYDQVNFVGRMNAAAVAANEGQYQPGPTLPESVCSADDEDFAKSLCQLLRSTYKIEKFASLFVIAPEVFLAAILRQLDSDCLAVLQGSVAINPALLNERELLRHMQELATVEALS